ncbi:MAG: hypothetical protein NTW59_03785 [Candidatus Diapherotrites archaeon]|nr:hypothetical protein [Candidatus Diapherotrites archaeon]
MAVGSGIGNFFARLFLGSLVNLAANFVFFAAGIFLAGKILKMQGNSIGKAFAVSLVIMVVSFVPQMFYFLDSFFTLLIMFAFMVVAIKTVYKCDWVNALLNLVIATVIATFASIAVNPLLVYAIGA